MKEHILAALREQFEEWEKLLASLSEQQITSPRFDLDWSIKDVVSHLWAWQQISIARMEAGRQDQEPELPGWIVNSIENWEENANQVNAKRLRETTTNHGRRSMKIGGSATYGFWKWEKGSLKEICWMGINMRG